eukprot:1509-Pyramimonas_sp.AAC.1
MSSEAPGAPGAPSVSPSGALARDILAESPYEPPAHSQGQFPAMRQYPRSSGDAVAECFCAAGSRSAIPRNSGPCSYTADVNVVSSKCVTPEATPHGRGH